MSSESPRPTISDLARARKTETETETKTKTETETGRNRKSKGTYKGRTFTDEWKRNGSNWRPDFELWGGHPDAIMRAYPGDPLDFYRSTTGPRHTSEEKWKTRPGPPEPGFATADDMRPSMRVDGEANHGWTTDVLVSEITRSSQVETAEEVIWHYKQSGGRCQITCAYCQSKSRSRDVHQLLKWYREHECKAPYLDEHLESRVGTGH